MPSPDTLIILGILLPASCGLLTLLWLFLSGAIKYRKDHEVQARMAERGKNAVYRMQDGDE